MKVRLFRILVYPPFFLPNYFFRPILLKVSMIITTPIRCDVG